VYSCDVAKYGTIGLSRYSSNRYGFHKRLTYEYSILIYDGEEFVQWGATKRLNHAGSAAHTPVGPDVRKENKVSEQPCGIFGLNFEELLASQYVQEDSLRIKLKLSLLSNMDPDQIRRHQVGGVLTQMGESPHVHIPAPSVMANMQGFFSEALHTDVTIVVGSTRIPVHGLLIAAASEVFHRQLLSGMRESQERVITVEGVEPAIFNLLVKYIYSEAFDAVEAALATAEDAEGGKCAMLLQLMAVSDQYQVLRLKAWCENRTLQYIDITTVFKILEQAWLHNAEHIERECLVFLKGHPNELAASKDYAALPSEALIKFTSLLLKLDSGAESRKRKHSEVS